MSIESEVSVSVAAFRWNEAVLREQLNSIVAVDLVKRAIRVEAAAKSGWSSPPSMPGHKPAVRTGRLRGSITWRLAADALSPYVDVGTNVFYAPFVELGTSRMQARPFLRPALKAAEGSFHHE